MVYQRNNKKGEGEDIEAFLERKEREEAAAEQRRRKRNKKKKQKAKEKKNTGDNNDAAETASAFATAAGECPSVQQEFHPGKEEEKDPDLEAAIATLCCISSSSSSAHNRPSLMAQEEVSFDIRNI